MYWLIVAGILTIIATGIAIHIHKVDIVFAPMHEIIIDTILWGVIIVIILCAVCVPIEFGVFESKYELQKELYSNISVDDNFILTANVVEINNELFERQATKERLGEWDFTPARILDMKPIGIK